MTQDQTTELLSGIREIKGALEDGGRRFDAIDERFENDAKEVAKIVKQRNTLVVILILALTAAAFSIGYAWNSGNQLDDQITTNRKVVCSQARSTAAAFREPLPGESHSHFLRRMYAQRETLLAVTGLECADVPGPYNFERQRQQALEELNTLLGGIPSIEGEVGRSSDTALPSDQSSTGGNLIANGGKQGTGSPGASETPGGPSALPPNEPSKPGGGSSSDPTQEPTDPQPAQPSQPNPVEPTDPPPATEPPAQQSNSGVLDPALNLVCETTLAGIRVCTRQ